MCVVRPSRNVECVAGLSRAFLIVLALLTTLWPYCSRSVRGGRSASEVVELIVIFAD